DRNRHEPVPFGRTSHLVGWHMSAQRRECRQASIQSPAQGCSMAQNDAGAVRLGSGKKEKQLPTGPILPHQSPARPQEGDHGRRSLPPYRHLPHAQGWDDGCTRTSAAITSIAVQPTSKNNAWLNAALNLGTLWRSSR